MTVDASPAGRPTALTLHRPVVVVEERVVRRQLRTRRDVAHRYQHHVAAESHVRLAGVIEKQHDRLVLVLGQRREVQLVGDLDLGLLQWRGKRAQCLGRDDVPALDGDDLTGRDRLDGDDAPALDVAVDTLAGLGRDPGRGRGRHPSESGGQADRPRQVPALEHPRQLQRGVATTQVVGHHRALALDLGGDELRVRLPGHDGRALSDELRSRIDIGGGGVVVVIGRRGGLGDRLAVRDRDARDVSGDRLQILVAWRLGEGAGELLRRLGRAVRDERFHGVNARRVAEGELEILRILHLADQVIREVGVGQRVRIVGRGTDQHLGMWAGEQQLLVRDHDDVEQRRNRVFVHRQIADVERVRRIAVDVGLLVATIGELRLDGVHVDVVAQLERRGGNVLGHVGRLPLDVEEVPAPVVHLHVVGTERGRRPRHVDRIGDERLDLVRRRLRIQVAVAQPFPRGRRIGEGHRRGVGRHDRQRVVDRVVGRTRPHENRDHDDGRDDDDQGDNEQAEAAHRSILRVDHGRSGMHSAR